MLKKVTRFIFTSFFFSGVVFSNETLIAETKKTKIFLSSSIDSSLNRLSTYSYPVAANDLSLEAIQNQNMDGSILKILAYPKKERKLIADITIKFPKDQLNWGDIWLTTDESCDSVLTQEILSAVIPKLSFTNLYTLVLPHDVLDTCFAHLSQFSLAGITKIRYCVYVTNIKEINTLPDEVRPHKNGNGYK